MERGRELGGTEIEGHSSTILCWHKMQSGVTELRRNSELKGWSWQPVTAARWEEFQTLFGEQGAYGGCWCMWWRSKRKDFEQRGNSGNKEAMRKIIQGGEVPGILGYLDGKPVGWCSVSPRETMGSLNRSPVLKRIDDEEVWSIVCFFVADGYRGKGIAGALINSAIEYVRAQGGRILEAYPRIATGEQLPPVSTFMGTDWMFEQAGFTKVAQPSSVRTIYRLSISASD